MHQLDDIGNQIAKEAENYLKRQTKPKKKIDLKKLLDRTIKTCFTVFVSVMAICVSLVFGALASGMTRAITQSDIAAEIAGWVTAVAALGAIAYTHKLLKKLFD